MKIKIKKAENNNIIKNLIINTIYLILIIEIQINLIANLIIISNFDSPYLFEWFYNILIKRIIGE